MGIAMKQTNTWKVELAIDTITTHHVHKLQKIPLYHKAGPHPLYLLTSTAYLTTQLLNTRMSVIRVRHA